MNILEISKEEVLSRLSQENGWWEDNYSHAYKNFPKRAYFKKFYVLVTQKAVRRAVIMMGPRRVGKTVMLLQCVEELIRSGVPPKHILYISLETPTYVGLKLEKILTLFREYHALADNAELYIFFDEVQYHKDWEVHLKTLVDTYSQIRFAASGSAAAALRMRSQESGAGRFTDFMLPPLTFFEYLQFCELEKELIIYPQNSDENYQTTDITKLNASFIDYLNYGGFPEVVRSPEIQKDIRRYVGQDIVDRVLLRDLPSLYGISDIQELNRLFAVLAYNTGNEISLEALSQTSGVTKATLKRYLEYLEAAFLIIKVRRVDDTGRHFSREHRFKIYLTNPSMRAALFSPVEDSEPAMGNLAETAILTQWFYAESNELLRYARWKDGEVDVVGLAKNLKPYWAYEIKWSDYYYENPKKLESLIKFSKRNNLYHATGSLTKTRSGRTQIDNVTIDFFPCSLECYVIGHRLIQKTL